MTLSSMEITYVYKGEAFPNDILNKMRPVLNVGNKSTSGYSYVANITSIENITNSNNTSTQMKVTITRVDLIGNRYTSSSSYTSSDWTNDNNSLLRVLLVAKK